MGQPKGLGEKCGVAAVVLKKNLDEYPLGGASFFLREMLDRLQHRGQESAGIVTFNRTERRKLKCLKAVGSVAELFKERDEKERERIFNYYNGSAGIGHVRYSTSGKTQEYEDLVAEAQPFFRTHGKTWKRFAIAFNGNLANYPELAEELSRIYEYDLDTEVDTEAIMHFLSIDAKILEEVTKRKPDIVDIISHSCRRFDGAYNITMINGLGEVIAFRDPIGIRPLVYGENDCFFAVASESVALEPLGIEKSNIREIEPGQVLIYDGVLRKEYYTDIRGCANCMFEVVYFSWDSSIFGEKQISINKIRRLLGEELVKTDPLREKIEDSPEEYLIIPVPDTAIPAAEGFAGALGLRIEHGIRKRRSGRGEGRGFIEKPGLRKLTMDSKYTVIEEVINYSETPKIIVVDDSSVRGDTSAVYVRQLRAAGAKEIHLRISCPPIRFPCFYGVDIPTLKELVAAGTETNEEAEEKLREKSGADSVHYQTIEGLVNAIPSKGLCLACLNGDYPTDYGRKRFEEQLE